MNASDERAGTIINAQYKSRTKEQGKKEKNYKRENQRSATKLNSDHFFLVGPPPNVFDCGYDLTKIDRQQIKFAEIRFFRNIHRHIFHIKIAFPLSTAKSASQIDNKHSRRRGSKD